MVLKYISIKKKIDNNLGLFTLDNSSLIFINPENNKRSRTKEQNSYINWLTIYFKLYIISNYNNDELQHLSTLHQKRSINSTDDLVSFVKLFSINEHLKLLDEVIKNGSL